MAFPTAPQANDHYTNPLNGRRYLWKICPNSGEGYWDHDPVFTTVSSNPFHDWDTTVTYKAGDYVFHNGYVFKAEHDNLGQDPDTAAGGEWTKRGKLQWGPTLNNPVNAGKTIAADANGNPQWQSARTYAAGISSVVGPHSKGAVTHKWTGWGQFPHGTGVGQDSYFAIATRKSKNPVEMLVASDFQTLRLKYNDSAANNGGGYLNGAAVAMGQQEGFWALNRWKGKEGTMATIDIVFARCDAHATMTIHTDYWSFNSHPCNDTLTLIWNDAVHEMEDFYLSGFSTFGIPEYHLVQAYQNGIDAFFWLP